MHFITCRIVIHIACHNIIVHQSVTIDILLYIVCRQRTENTIKVLEYNRFTSIFIYLVFEHNINEHSITNIYVC